MPGRAAGCPRTRAPGRAACRRRTAPAPCSGRAARFARPVRRCPTGPGRSRCRASGRRSSPRRSAGRRAAGLRSRRATSTTPCRFRGRRREGARGVDDRRLHHPRAVVEVRVLEDRAHDGPRPVPASHVQLLEAAARRGRRRGRDEVAPELRDEERRVPRMLDAELDGVAPVELSAPPEDALRAEVVPLAVEAEARRAHALAPVVPEARQRARLLADVALGVPASGAEREELHQLTGVVLVRRPLRVVGPGEPEQHRGVARDRERQLPEGAEPVAAEERVLPEHEPLRADALVRRGEPVVPDERHPLHQRPVAADHAVEPPEMVVAPRVARRERASFLVLRARADESLASRRGQCANGLVQALPRELPGLASARPETGTPEQALGLLGAEFAPVDGNLGGG